MTNKTYDILKFITQVVLPLLSAFVVTVFDTWHIQYGVEISATIMAIDTLLGGILMKLSSDYHKGDV